MRRPQRRSSVSSRTNVRLPPAASEVCTSRGQETATTFESGPASTVEHLMVETERRGIALPRMPQGRGDGASSAGQQGFDDQALDFTPSGYAEETLKGRQEGASVC